jgi:hypothetical protein
MADVAEPLVPLEGVDFLLNAIGFNQAAQRERIMEAGLAGYEDFHYLVKKDKIFYMIFYRLSHSL